MVNTQCYMCGRWSGLHTMDCPDHPQMKRVNPDDDTEPGGGPSSPPGNPVAHGDVEQATDEEHAKRLITKAWEARHPPPLHVWMSKERRRAIVDEMRARYYKAQGMVDPESKAETEAALLRNDVDAGFTLNLPAFSGRPATVVRLNRTEGFALWDFVMRLKDQSKEPAQ